MDDTRLTLIEAIVRKKTVAAWYNGTRLRLAPHFLFERHGDLFVAAFNLDKAWGIHDEPRLGQFKLAGLGGAELLEYGFDTMQAYSAAPPRADDQIIVAI